MTLWKFASNMVLYCHMYLGTVKFSTNHTVHSYNHTSYIEAVYVIIFPEPSCTFHVQSFKICAEYVEFNATEGCGG